MKKFGLVSKVIIFLVASLSTNAQPVTLFANQNLDIETEKYEQQVKGNPYSEVEEASILSSVEHDSDVMEHAPEDFPNQLESAEWTTLGTDSKAFMGMQ